MALLSRGVTTCPICDAVITEADDIVATSHFIADYSDPLVLFSDAAMHSRCFLGWEHRQEFIKKYNERFGAMTWGNGTYFYMEETGKISVLPRNVDSKGGL
jgi:hypothetical protein